MLRYTQDWMQLQKLQQNKTYLWKMGKQNNIDKIGIRMNFTTTRNWDRRHKRSLWMKWFQSRKLPPLSTIIYCHKFHLPKYEDTHGYIEILCTKKAVDLHYFCPKRGTPSLSMWKTVTNSKATFPIHFSWSKSSKLAKDT